MENVSRLFDFNGNRRMPLTMMMKMMWLVIMAMYVCEISLKSEHSPAMLRRSAQQMKLLVYQSIIWWTSMLLPLNKVKAKSVCDKVHHFSQQARGKVENFPEIISLILEFPSTMDKARDYCEAHVKWGIVQICSVFAFKSLTFRKCIQTNYNWI